MNNSTPFSVNQHNFIYTLQTVKPRYIFSYADIKAGSPPLVSTVGKMYQKFSLQNNLIAVLLNLTNKPKEPFRIKS
jgi:hypothetical protein